MEAPEDGFGPCAIGNAVNDSEGDKVRERVEGASKLVGKARVLVSLAGESAAAERRGKGTRSSQEAILPARDSHSILISDPLPLPCTVEILPPSKNGPHSTIHRPFEIRNRVLDPVNGFHLWATERGGDDEAGDVVQVTVGDEEAAVERRKRSGIIPQRKRGKE